MNTTDYVSTIREHCLTRVNDLLIQFIITDGDPEFYPDDDFCEEAQALRKVLRDFHLKLRDKKTTGKELVEIDNSIEQIYVIYDQLLSLYKDYEAEKKLM